MVAMTIEPFRCWHCGMASLNPSDARERYCGNCHHFCDDVDDESVETLLDVFERGAKGLTAPPEPW